MPIIIIAVLLLVIIVGLIISGYNKMISLRNETDKSFANIDIFLKQRADEIPELVKVAKASFEKESTALKMLTELRTAYLETNDVGEKIRLSNHMSDAFGTFFAVSESYPALKSIENFQQLQSRVSAVEDHISYSREAFNNEISRFNTVIQSFPNILFASLLGFRTREFLKISKAEIAYSGIDL